MTNLCMLVGRLVDEVKKENNRYIATIAVNRQFKNDDGVYETDFISCILWDNVGEQTLIYCKKGDLVGIKGRLQTEDNKIIVVAEKVTFLSSKKED